MTNEKWGEILDKVQDTFEVEAKGTEAIEDIPNGTVEYIVFTSPMGRVRLERATTPRVEGTKAAGGSKYGAGHFVEKIYSDTEIVNTFSAWKDVNGQWEKISADAFI